MTQKERIRKLEHNLSEITFRFNQLMGWLHWRSRKILTIRFILHKSAPFVIQCTACLFLQRKIPRFQATCCNHSQMYLISRRLHSNPLDVQGLKWRNLRAIPSTLHYGKTNMKPILLPSSLLSLVSSQLT